MFYLKLFPFFFFITASCLASVIRDGDDIIKQGFIPLLVSKELTADQFFLSAQPATWSNAKIECEKAGMNLVAIKNASIQSQIVSQLNLLNLGGIYVYTGGNDIGTEGTKVWTDGSRFVYENSYCTGNSAGSDCMVLHGASWMWHFLACSTSLRFICQVVQDEATGEQGYRQEIVLYEGDAEDATFHVFRDYIPDLSEWPFYRKKTVTKVCSRGAWIYYKEANFSGYVYGNYSHKLEDNCHIKASGARFPLEESLSLRFIGSPDTSNESVSFFSEEFFQGKEFTSDPVTLSVSGINETINSVVITGYKNWTFFEDTNFNGPDRCFENSISRSLGVTNATAIRPKDIDFYGRDALTQSRLKTVGSASILCACKTEEIGIPGGQSDLHSVPDSLNDDDLYVTLT